MGNTFAPSLEAARASTSTPIQYEIHPGGANGAKFSIQKMVEKLREARKDVRLRAWAGKALEAAGDPKSVHDRAQAILDAIKKPQAGKPAKVIYSPDPVNTELVVAPHVQLCLDENDLCIRVSDCDDLTVLTGSLYEAMGWSVQIIACAYDLTGVPSHVFLAVKTENGWEKVDPSTDLPVGQATQYMQDWWIDPMKDEPLMLSGRGDYIGVGQPLGLGEVSGVVRDTVVSQFASALWSLKKSYYDALAALDEVQRTRESLGLDYDPEPQSGTIEQLSDFPAGGVWTRGMATVSRSVLDFVETIIEAGDDALHGGRKLIVDEKNASDIYVESKPTDKYRWAKVVQGAQEDIVAISDASGKIISGITSSGKTLQAQTVLNAIQQAGKSLIGLQEPVIATAAIVALIVGVLISAVIYSVAIVYLAKRFCDLITTKAREATNRTAIECIASGKCPPDILKTLSDNRVNEMEAQRRADEADPFKGALDAAGNVVKWLVIGGVVVGAVVIGAPLIKEAVESGRQALARRRT